MGNEFDYLTKYVDLAYLEGLWEALQTVEEYGIETLRAKVRNAKNKHEPVTKADTMNALRFVHKRKLLKDDEVSPKWEQMLHCGDKHKKEHDKFTECIGGEVLCRCGVRLAHTSINVCLYDIMQNTTKEEQEKYIESIRDIVEYMSNWRKNPTPYP